MHKPSLALTLLFLTLLGAYFLFQPVQEITTYSQVTTLTENTRIITQGTVIKQTFSQQSSYLLLSNNITLLTTTQKSYLNQTVQAQGTLDTFRYPKIKVTTITRLPKS
ncbi:hypothetical protein EXS73_00950 [Candidatus Pacearchaeota archaeon]|nr:hypothetical protein [Candidatus Pacearchaeota archaeon]